MKLIFYGQIQEGKLLLNDKQNFLDTIAKQNDYPRVRVNIENEKKTRSNDYNRYYWGYVLTEMSKETGHSTEELHEVFKKMFLPKRFIKIKSKEVETNRSSAILDTPDFKDYVERVKSFGATELEITWFDIEEL